jgi:hypothetical protein
MGCQGGPAEVRPPLWEVYADLCETAVFQQRVAWPLHGLVVKHLVRADCRRRAALELHQIVAHPLFDAASAVGRRNALADPAEALRLLQSALPDASTQRRQADRLAARHLARLAAEPRRLVHRWVLRRADTLRQAFFEPRPGSASDDLWGQRYARAAGRDWYQRCLATMSKATTRRVCRGGCDALGTDDAGTGPDGIAV